MPGKSTEHSSEGSRRGTEGGQTERQGAENESTSETLWNRVNACSMKHLLAFWRTCIENKNGACLFIGSI